MQEAMKYGNHKSAKENEALCLELAAKDATLGYGAVFPVSCAEKIANGEVYPLGIQFQNAINAEGEIYEKARLTHDLSFPKEQVRKTKAQQKRKRTLDELGKTYPQAKKRLGPSLNMRCNREELTPCIYGQSVRRTCHIIQRLRQLRPFARMMGTKTDLDKAYRRMHTSANSAARSMAIVGNLLHVLFRLPFGAAPAPSEWCPIMEMIVDLATKLVKCKNWDPQELKSP